MKCIVMMHIVTTHLLVESGVELHDEKCGAKSREVLRGLQRTLRIGLAWVTESLLTILATLAPVFAVILSHMGPVLT